MDGLPLRCYADSQFKELKSVQTPLDGELALLMRPIPSTMATDDEPVIIGGLPRLPDDMDWPRQKDGTPTHFFAEFDLSRLKFHQNEHRTPDFPDEGTLFVFIPLGDRGFHTDYTAQVLYTAASTSDLPERRPPPDIYNVLEQDPSYMHSDGMTDDGTVILRRHVDVLPFFSPLSSFQNRELRQSGNEEERKRGFDAKMTQAAVHKKNIAKALQDARPLNALLDGHVSRTQSVQVLPASYARHLAESQSRRQNFDPEMLDWRFVYDWSHFFYARCLHRTRKEMRRAATNWFSKWFRSRILRRVDGHIAEFETIQYSPSDEFTPQASVQVPDASAPFDEQAKGWLLLAAGLKGPLSPHLQKAFVDMLVAIDRRAKKSGSNTDPRPAEIGLVDSYVRGSSVTSETTLTYASDAFAQAVSSELVLDPQQGDGMSQSDRWDLRLAKIYSSAASKSDHARAVLGTTPLQMFGRGDAVQSAVDDHIGDTLLLQIGEAFGLPLDIGPDMAVHLWIKPEDLRSGCFDHVETTIEMS